MKPFLSCKHATRLLLAREDRRLARHEALRLRLHLMICRACPVFARQARLMRIALQRWRERG